MKNKIIHKAKGLSDRAVAWIFITPTLLLLLAINIYPLIYAISMSFTNFYANKLGREIKWVGLKNYAKILGKEAIWERMQITASFMFWTLLLQAIIGLMLICLAGLRSIPNYLYEAAEVDRANRLQQFIYITLPSVLPFLLLALLFRGIENFKMFDMVVELTSGGPGSATELASIQLKREAFEKWKTGYSSAYAVILFVTIFGFGNVYVKVMNKIKDR